MRAPHCGKKHSMRQHAFRTLSHVEEEIKFFGRQFNLLPPNLHSVFLAIDGEVPNRKRGCIRLNEDCPSSSHVGPDACEEFLDTERRGYIIIRSGIQCLYLGRFLVSY